MSYINILQKASLDAGNCACMGLDPVSMFIPKNDLDETGITPFFEELFSAMQKEGLKPSAFKPNIGYYTIYDRPFSSSFSGSIALAKTLSLIKKYFKDVPIILDSKRGDIATSSLNYAKEAFEVWQVSATTVSPYMGGDSIEPFISDSYKEKAIYILARTSNVGALDFQNLFLSKDDDAKNDMLYMKVAKKIVSYAKEGRCVGAVVGAKGLMELKEIASFFTSSIEGGIPLLIPGVGSQGGSAEEVISILKSSKYDLSLVRINSSSALTHPWKKKDVPYNYIEECLKNIKVFFDSCKI